MFPALRSLPAVMQAHCHAGRVQGASLFHHLRGPWRVFRQSDNLCSHTRLCQDILCVGKLKRSKKPKNPEPRGCEIKVVPGECCLEAQSGAGDQEIWCGSRSSEPRGSSCQHNGASHALLSFSEVGEVETREVKTSWKHKGPFSCKRM